MRINYEQFGPKSDIQIVLLHDWASDLETFNPLAQMLSQNGIAVYSLDLPGFGKSDKLEKIMYLNEYVELLKKFLDSLNIEGAVFLGHGFGAKLATALAIKYPYRTKKLVLISPVNFYRDSITPAAPMKTKSFWRKLFKRTNRTKQNDDNRLLAQTAQELASTNFDNRVNLLKTPVLVLWPENERTDALGQIERIAKEAPFSRLEIVAGADHSLPQTYPQIVAKLVTNFVK